MNELEKSKETLKSLNYLSSQALDVQVRIGKFACHTGGTCWFVYYEHLLWEGFDLEEVLNTAIAATGGKLKEDWQY